MAGRGRHPVFEPVARAMKGQKAMSSVVKRNGFVRCGSVLGLVCGMAALVARQAAADACGYPYGSGRTAVVFNESTVLRAFDPVTSQTTVLGQGLTIKAFYSDEHALTLGATSVSIKTAAGTSVQCSNPRLVVRTMLCRS